MTKAEKVIYNNEYQKYLDRKAAEDPDFFCKEFKTLTERIKEEYEKADAKEFNRQMEYYEAQVRILKERMACQLLKEHGYSYNESFVFGLSDVQAAKRW